MKREHKLLGSKFFWRWVLYRALPVLAFGVLAAVLLAIAPGLLYGLSYLGAAGLLVFLVAMGTYLLGLLVVIIRSQQLVVEKFGLRDDGGARFGSVMLDVILAIV